MRASSSDDGRDLESVAHFAEAATGAIHAQRRDIDRLSGYLIRIENDVQFLKKFMVEMQGYITRRFGVETEHPVATSVSANGLGRVNLTINEVEMITGSIARLNTKTIEFDDLKLEMDFLKTRLGLLEADSLKTFRRLSTEPYWINTGRPSCDANISRRKSSFGGSRGFLSNSEKRKAREVEISLDTNRLLSSQPPPIFNGWKRTRYSENPSTTLQPLKTVASRTPLPDLPPFYPASFPDPCSNDCDNGHSSINGPLASIDTLQMETYHQDLQTNDLVRQECFSPTTSTSHKAVLRESERNSPRTAATESSITIALDHPSSKYEPIPVTEPEPAQNTTKTPRSRRRRGRSDCLRDENGVRIRKNGKPDGRAGNYKYLKAYYDKKKAQKDREQKKEFQEVQSGEKEGDNESVLEVEEKKSREDDSDPQLSREALERIAGAAQARVRT